MLKGRCPQHWLIWFHGLLRQNRRAKQAHVPLEHHHTRQCCCCLGLLPTETERLNKRLLLFYRCYSRFLSRDGELEGDLIEKISYCITAGAKTRHQALEWKVKGVIRSNCQVHFASEDETRPFLKHDDLMLQSFKRQAFYYCLPPSFS